MTTFWFYATRDRAHCFRAHSFVIFNFEWVLKLAHDFILLLFIHTSTRWSVYRQESSVTWTKEFCMGFQFLPLWWNHVRQKNLYICFDTKINWRRHRRHIIRSGLREIEIESERIKLCNIIMLMVFFSGKMYCERCSAPLSSAPRPPPQLFPECHTYRQANVFFIMNAFECGFWLADRLIYL